MVFGHFGCADGEFQEGKNLGFSSNEWRGSVLIALNFSMLYLCCQFAVNSLLRRYRRRPVLHCSSIYCSCVDPLRFWLNEQ